MRRDVSMSGRVRVAAFDLDHTLTTHDCVVPFLRQVAGTGTLVRRLALDRTLLPGLLARDRERLKTASARAAFTGRTVADVEREAWIFARRVHTDRLRRDVVARYTAHVEAGDVVVVVSASFEVYVSELVALLGGDRALATRLEVHEGRFTGNLLGPNCRGAEKVRRVHAFLDERGWRRDVVELVAYGDSAGDRELLAEADRAHWTARYRP
jgi:phosphatidylglycerophosphatase C